MKKDNNNNNKYKIIIKILIGLLVLISLAFAGYYAYDKLSNRGKVINNVEVKHTNDDKKTEEKVLDYSGKFEKDGSELIITKNGDSYNAEIGIFRLGSFSGTVSNIKDNKLIIKSSTSGNEIEFEFDYNTKILSVIKSSWNLLSEGRTIDFNK